MTGEIFIAPDRETTSLARPAEGFGIRPEEILQPLRFPASHLTNSIGSVALFPAIPEVLPKMAQMIEGVRIDSLLHSLSPLLIRDWDITNWPTQHTSKGFDNFPHCQSLGYQRV